MVLKNNADEEELDLELEDAQLEDEFEDDEDESLDEVKASFGVNASVADPTGSRIKKLKNSKDQGDKSSMAQGSSKKPPSITAEDIDVSDDITAMFEGSDLSDEFKAKAASIFEAAVVSKVNETISDLSEEMEAELDASVSAISDDLTEELDDYLNNVVEHWLDENRLAVDVGLKSQLTEQFLVGLRSLFNEHYIDIPEDKVDVVEELAARIEDLENQLNNTMSENMELNGKIQNVERDLAFEEVAEGLTETQVAKLESLSEAIDSNSTESFRDKVQTLRESYFPSSDRDNENRFDEDPIDDEDSVAPRGDASVLAYADAITRHIKK